MFITYISVLLCTCLWVSGNRVGVRTWPSRFVHIGPVSVESRHASGIMWSPRIRRQGLGGDREISLPLGEERSVATLGEMIILRDGVKRVEVGHGDVIREREREERKPGSVRHFGSRYVARRHHSRRVKFWEGKAVPFERGSSSALVHGPPGFHRSDAAAAFFGVPSRLRGAFAVAFLASALRVPRRVARVPSAVAAWRYRGLRPSGATTWVAVATVSG